MSFLKWPVLLVVLVLLVWSRHFFIPNTPLSTPQTSVPILSPTKTPNPSISIVFNDTQYRASWFIVYPRFSIRLIPNFTEKKTARTIIDQLQCKNLVNGGYYTKEFQPLGLFISDEKVLSRTLTNPLVNGFVAKSKNGTQTVSAVAPDPAKILWALQSGPMLVEDGQKRLLSINNDEYARRIIAATTNQGLLVFIALFSEDNPYQGPLLAHVPSILMKLEERQNFTFVNAVNLDGGSASTFFSQDLFLQELTPIGSFLCISY